MSWVNSSEGQAWMDDPIAQMFSAPQTIHGPLAAQVGGKWINVPAFTVYGSSGSYQEGNGASTTYYDQNGKPITDPLQDPRYGGGIGGSNYFNLNADGTPGSLYGSVSAGHPSFGGQALESAMPYMALAATGAFAGAAAGGLGAAGAGGAGSAGSDLAALTYGSGGSGALASGAAGAGGLDAIGQMVTQIPQGMTATTYAQALGYPSADAWLTSLGAGAAGGTAGALATGGSSSGGTMDLSDIFGGDPLGNGATLDLSSPSTDWLTQLQQSLGPQYDPTLSGDALNANAGLSDFVKGAIQSGNLGQLASILPSLPPGTSTAIKALLGGGSGTTGGSGLLGGLGSLLGGGSGLATLLGGLLGSQNGAKQAGTTTTVQDIPDWQKPYVQNLFNQAGSALTQSQQAQTANQPLVNAGSQQLTDTINGKYLDPSSNPYLSGMFNAAADQVKNQVNSNFEASGRYGSGAQTGELGYQLGNLANNMYGNAYAQGRQQQLTAATAAPGYATSASQSPFAPLQAYGSIVGQGFGSQTQSPYFTNPAGGALSGALAGYGLSKAFG